MCVLFFFVFNCVSFYSRLAGRWAWLLSALFVFFSTVLFSFPACGMYALTREGPRSLHFFFRRRCHCYCHELFNPNPFWSHGDIWIIMEQKPRSSGLCGRRRKLMYTTGYAMEGNGNFEVFKLPNHTMRGSPLCRWLKGASGTYFCVLRRDVQHGQCSLIQYLEYGTRVGILLGMKTFMKN